MEGYFINSLGPVFVLCLSKSGKDLLQFIVGPIDYARDFFLVLNTIGGQAKIDKK